MYKISVPITNSNVNKENRESVLCELRRFDAERVFLAIGTYKSNDAERQEELDSLRENCAFFKENGLEVGVWMWAFELPEKTDYRNMRTILGEEHPERACPTDKNFVKFTQEYIKNLALCGFDLIMFDDDLRYNFFTDSTPGCLCDGHIAMINATTGEERHARSLPLLL